MMQNWYTYILRCKDKTLYTGITNDIDRRVIEHNNGIGSKYTRSRLPVALLYYEQFQNRSDASKREYQIKKMSRAVKLELISQVNK